MFCYGVTFSAMSTFHLRTKNIKEETSLLTNHIAAVALKKGKCKFLQLFQNIKNKYSS